MRHPLSLNAVIAIMSLFLFAFAAAKPAAALESAWKSADYIQARLITARNGMGGSAAHIDAALELRLGDGWHSYWRMPGEGGLAPVLDWKNSKNVADIKVGWPLPRRYETFGLYSFGYEGAVLLPLTVKPAVPGKDIALALNADIMVCKDICVPQTLDLMLMVPGVPGGDSPHALRIAEALKNLPAAGDTPALKIETAVVGPDALVVRAFSQRGFEGADLFVESGDLRLTAPPVITPEEKDPRYASMVLAKPEGTENLAKDMMGKKAMLTLSAGGNAIEKEISF